MNKVIIPSKVNICAIMYRVVEIDGMIVFSEDCGMWGCCDRIIFRFHKYGGWRLELKPTFDTIMASHIEEAYKLVKKWRGDDFGRFQM